MMIEEFEFDQTLRAVQSNQLASFVQTATATSTQDRRRLIIEQLECLQ